MALDVRPAVLYVSAVIARNDVPSNGLSNMSSDENSAAGVLNTVVRLLEQLDAEARRRVLKAVETFFHTDLVGASQSAEYVRSPTETDFPKSRPNFSDNVSLSPKEFLAQKQPRTDVERITCLAYYLTYFRETPFFKTLDLAKLNTEAAHPKFSNATYATNNAVNTGYLAPATNGQRQISAAGELFVQTLPDREAARAIMT